MRKTFSKGPRYQENRTIDYGKGKESVNTGIKSCIKCWCNRVALIHVFLKQALISTIDDKVNYRLSEPLTKNNKKAIGVRDKISTKGLNLLRNKFVVIPTNIASRSIAFVCQRSYSEVFRSM